MFAHRPTPVNREEPGELPVLTRSGHCLIRYAFALPEAVEHWSLTTLREKLVKIGAKVVSHGRYVKFQLAEVAVPRNLFRKILRRIDDLRPRSPARCRTGAWNHVG